jgi:glutathione peroxidase
MTETIYQFSTTSLQGKPIHLKEYKGKVILVLNTASLCGLTPQYTGLQKLYDTYKDQGLVIIGFPCNQFRGQEPGDEAQISSNCLVNYGVTFPMMHKVDVNGPNTDPIFVYLKNCLPGLLGMKDIKWNFGKFLIGKDGVPVKRFAPTTEPKGLEKDIQNLLNLK